MKTGFIKLDEIIDLKIPQLIFLASRPAMGKSTLAYNISKDIVLNQNKAVLFFNLETTKRVMINKLISSETDIEGRRISKRYTNKEEKAKIKEIRQRFSNKLLYINDIPLSIEEIYEEALRMKNKADIQFIVVDYLQLVGSMEEGKLNSNQLIIKVVRMLKKLSVELKVPILLLSQLSRKPDNRKEHRPKISDIKRITSIVDKIDTIMLLYRNDYYHYENRTEVAEVIIPKNINGKIGIVELKSEFQYARFENI